MSNVQVAETKPRERVPLNGVDTPTLFATINAVKAQPELARFRFTATNRWVKGTHSRSRIEVFNGAGSTHRHTGDIEFGADHPAVLVGADNAPTPVEFLLHAIAACITSGIGNIAAARGVTLTEVESTVEGDIDLHGILGLSDQVRNGYEQLRVHFLVKGDAAPEEPGDRRAGEGALGGVRRADQRHRGRHHRGLHEGLIRRAQFSRSSRYMGHM